MSAQNALQPSFGAARSPLGSPLLLTPGPDSSVLFLLAFCQQCEFLPVMAGGSGEPVKTPAFPFREMLPPALPPLLLPKMSLSQGKAVQHIDSHVQIPRLSTQPGGGLGRPKKNQVLLKNNQPDSHAAQQLF